MREYFHEPYIRKSINTEEEIPIVLYTPIKEMEYGEQCVSSEILVNATCKGWDITICSNRTCPTVIITPPAKLQDEFHIRSIHDPYDRYSDVELLRKLIEKLVKRNVYASKTFGLNGDDFKFVYSYNEFYDYIGSRNSDIHASAGVGYKRWKTEEVLFDICKTIYRITDPLGFSANPYRRDEIIESCRRDFKIYVKHEEIAETIGVVNKDEFFMLLNGELNFEEEVVE